MRGIGLAHAAVTVVNALPLGIGSAIGIDLGVRAEIRISEGPALPSTGSRISPSDSATPVVLAALEEGRAHFLKDRHAPLLLELHAEVPPGKGLKSSSAVSSAIVRATARAAGSAPSAAEVAHLAAEAGRKSGTSATGAFDDALAGLEPGVLVTDNRADRLLARFDLPAELEAVIWVPAETHPPAPSLRQALARESEAAREAVEAARAGAWPLAMDHNSQLVERALGYDYTSLRAACRAEGAVAAGVSGLGPAFAVLAPPGVVGAMRRVLAAHRGDVLHVGLLREPFRSAEAG